MFCFSDNKIRACYSSLTLPKAAMSHYSFEAYVLHSFLSSSLRISLAWTVVLFLCINLYQAIFMCWVLLQLNHLSLVCHFFISHPYKELLLCYIPHRKHQELSGQRMLFSQWTIDVQNENRIQARVLQVGWGWEDNLTENSKKNPEITLYRGQCKNCEAQSFNISTCIVLSFR